MFVCVLLPFFKNWGNSKVRLFWFDGLSKSFFWIVLMSWSSKNLLGYMKNSLVSAFISLISHLQNLLRLPVFFSWHIF